MQLIVVCISDFDTVENLGSLAYSEGTCIYLLSLLKPDKSYPDKTSISLASTTSNIGNLDHTLLCHPVPINPFCPFINLPNCTYSISLMKLN